MKYYLNLKRIVNIFIALSMMLGVMIFINSCQSDIENQTMLIDDKVVYSSVEIMPIFPGCEDESTTVKIEKCTSQKMYQHLYEVINYPYEARMNGIQGKVILSFIITKNGDVDYVTILEDIGGGCGEEAKEAIESMNNIDWIPGKEGGKNVNVYFELPVVFKLN